ncbi:MAG: flagellar basal body-associated FliL family protein [Planctomycetaceae bacterium]|nr:flagellar basal body-associated FliL family protein [Planctomycetaceae bacterium]
MSNDPTANENADAAPARRFPAIVVWGLAAFVSAAAGVAVPLLLMGETGADDASQPAPLPTETLSAEQMLFVPFGDVTVNLDEGRMNRYLRIKISLQIDKTQEQFVNDALTQRGLVLRNWLISHLSDKELDEIRGAAGQNMLRREIRDQFNIVLCPDGFDRVFDVLFEEFNVQ